MEPRLVTLADVHELAAWHHESFVDGRWSHSQIQQSLENRAVCGWLIGDKGFILAQYAGDQAEILTLCVRPNARRRGFARILVNCAVLEARIRHAERIFLEVARDNSVANALYEKSGFEIIGTRPGYYARSQGPIDALMLALAL